MNERDRTFPPPELHWSELKAMGKSPAHFRAAYEHPKPSTPPMQFGSLVHSVLLPGGDKYVAFEGERSGNRWKDFKAQHEGEMIVTVAELAKAKRIARAVQTDPVAAPLLGIIDGRYADVETEKTISWSMLGRKCGGTIDLIAPGRIVEVKTTSPSLAAPGTFTRHALKMGYHAQVSWYADGARAAGHDVLVAWIVCVETEPPYDVVVHKVTQRAMDEGRKLIRLWMERVTQCEAAGVWPGYAQSPVDLDVVEDAGLMIDGEEVFA